MKSLSFFFSEKKISKARPSHGSKEARRFGWRVLIHLNNTFSLDINALITIIINILGVTTVIELVKLLFVMLAFHTRKLISVPAALCPIQLPASAPGQAPDVPNYVLPRWSSWLHVFLCLRPGCCGYEGMSQRMEAIALSLFLCIANKQTNKQIYLLKPNNISA